MWMETRPTSGRLWEKRLVAVGLISLGSKMGVTEECQGVSMSALSSDSSLPELGGELRTKGWCGCGDFSSPFLFLSPLSCDSPPPSLSSFMGKPSGCLSVVVEEAGVEWTGEEDVFSPSCPGLDAHLQGGPKSAGAVRTGPGPQSGPICFSSRILPCSCPSNFPPFCMDLCGAGV